MTLALGASLSSAASLAEYGRARRRPPRSAGHPPSRCHRAPQASWPPARGCGSPASRLARGCRRRRAARGRR
eukprot:2824395-Pleurochrysis_carterae.AAC.1